MSGASGNRFDERAATWDDDPDKRERARAVAEAIREAVPLEPHMRLLEYGAGTGLVSQALRERVGAVTLADSSQGMLQVLRAKASDGTIPDAHVWDLDLARDTPGERRFEVVVTAMTLHHIPELPPILRAFATMLEPGGYLCVADLEREDGSFHDEDFEGHHGFDREDLRAWLEEAGFGEVRFEVCGDVTRHGRTYGLFLATCRRAGS